MCYVAHNVLRGTQCATQHSSTHSHTCKKKAISQNLAGKGNETAEKQTLHTLKSVCCTKKAALLCEIISDGVVNMVPMVRGKIKSGECKLYGCLKKQAVDCRKL